MYRPLQPEFKIITYLPKKVPIEGDFIPRGKNAIDRGTGGDDITQSVGWGVTYEERKDLINTLNFTVVKNVETLITGHLKIGNWVVLYGGFYTDEEKEMKKVFIGNITRLRTNFTTGGVISVDVECVSGFYQKMNKEIYSSYSYPMRGSSTKYFVNIEDEEEEKNMDGEKLNPIYANPRPSLRDKDILTIEDIVRAIASENKVELREFKIPLQAKNVTFTPKNFIQQRNLTDWEFLRKLGAKYGFFIHQTIENNKEVLYVLNSYVKTQQMTDILDVKDIGFLYQSRSFNDFNPDTSVPKDIEIQKFDKPEWNRIRTLRDVTVTEDVVSAFSTRFVIEYFDDKTGKHEQTTADRWQNEQGEWVTRVYEYDDKIVQRLVDSNHPIAETISLRGCDHLNWKDDAPPGTTFTEYDLNYYYKEKFITDSKTSVYDQAYLGIDITATCNMDLNIKSQKVYPIRGIFRYSSANTVEDKYMLMGLKHIWNADGAITELEFKK